MFDESVRIPHLIVIPGKDLYQITSHHAGEVEISYRGMRRVSDIGGDYGLGSDLEDVLPFGGLRGFGHYVVHFFYSRTLLGDEGDVGYRTDDSRHAYRYAVEFAVELGECL